MIFSIKGWRKFGLNHDRKVIRSWLSEVRQQSRQVFTNGLKNGPHTGKIYSRGSRKHRASINRAGAEFPHSDSGNLLASLKDRQTRNSATIGTNAPHSDYLRKGTSKMKRRRMSVEALREGATNARPASIGWVKWQKGDQNVRPI